MKTIDTLNCKILTFNTDHCVLQFTGSREDIDKVLATLKPLGIDDIARTGAAAMERKY
jgi:acetolactate synthase small subunit